MFRPPADPPFKVARLTQLPHFKGTVHLKISVFFFFLRERCLFSNTTEQDGWKQEHFYFIYLFRAMSLCRKHDPVTQGNPQALRAVSSRIYYHPPAVPLHRRKGASTRGWELDN